MRKIEASSSFQEKDQYTIFFDNSLIEFNDFVERGNYSTVFILVDENTKLHCLPFLDENLATSYSVIEINSGEKHKSLKTCEEVWNVLLENHADRKSLMVNLGGGVIGDMGGFCAATYKRGFDFVQIPTTLLAQVDASVGGKLGVDFKGFKNNIGLFKNPKAVFINTHFLSTLPTKELRSGFAELVKHELISQNGQWEAFKKINELTVGAVIPFIEDSIALKNEVVKSDPLEKGLRKILNFGHTIGHALETFHLDTDQHLLHGEAIAIGMICECYLSSKVTGFPKDTLKEITTYLTTIFGHHPNLMQDTDQLLKIMQQDKKNNGKVINFTMLKNIGQPILNQEIDDKLILASLDYYNSLSQS